VPLWLIPHASTHTLARPQHERDLLEHWIKIDHLDLTHKTEKTGRPYRLVCQKNSQSYHVALALRKADQIQLENLHHIERNGVAEKNRQ
jgi:hypothetical protein